LSLSDSVTQTFNHRLHLATSLRILLIAVCLAIVSGCANALNAERLLHSPSSYSQSSKFVGVNGPISKAQGKSIVDTMEREQQKQSDILQTHLKFEQTITKAPLTLGNKVTLLVDADNTYRAMFDAIAHAHDSINVESYIFSDGKIGQKFADTLIEQQRQGVQVNVIYDAVGSHLTSNAFFDRLKQAGIQVLEFNPIKPWEPWRWWSFDHRDHRKIMVVDGKIAFTGGINISEEYASGISKSRMRRKIARSDALRDTDIEVEGPAVAEFQHLFIDEWNDQDGPELKARNYFPKQERHGDDIVRVIGAEPGDASVIYPTLISAITSAETNVFITDAYFAPDSQMLDALESAAQRGVDVELLLPSKADEPFISAAARYDYVELMESGVRIHEWKGKMLHAKTATIVGSSNLDWWSIARNNEVNATILGFDFAKQVELMFHNDLEESEPVEIDTWRQRSFLDRSKELFAHLFQRFL
jgi:cardiolipin synthase